MAVSIYNTVLSLTPTPTLIGTNPVPDGDVTIYVNMSGTNLFSTSAITTQGSIDWWIFSQTIGPNVGNSISSVVPDGTNLYINYVYTGPTNNGFYAYCDDEITENVYFNIYVTPNTMAGTMTCNNVYTSAGLVNNNLTWAGSTTTTSTGSFNVDVSSAGFTTVNSVNAIAVNNTSTGTACPLTSLTNVTSTSVSGNVVQGTTSSDGQPSVVLAGSGVPVYVTVYGQ
jgi:hypothetical protein